MNDTQTLSANQYTIEFTNGPSAIYKITNDGRKEWICNVADPVTATTIVEGLILVEQKRFYYPDSEPVFNVQEKKPAPAPPFLTVQDNPEGGD